jgi:hypothetical protein
MDDLFAFTILLDGASITVPSSPFRATLASIGSGQSDPETEDDEELDDSDDEEDELGTDPPVFIVAEDSEDEIGQDPPPIFTPSRARKASLRVAIPDSYVSMRTVSTFACSPALATTGLINFETKEGQSLYKSAVEKLGSQFSRKNPDVNLLINQLRIRVRREGWGGIVLINTKAGRINLLSHPHLVTLKQVQHHVRRFALTESRQRQNDAMLFGCLIGSLDNHTLMIMSNMQAHEFLDPMDMYAEPHESGVAYLKMLLDRAEYNSQAVVANLQIELSQLHLVIGKQFKFDIPSFHRHVETLLQKLTSRRIPFGHVKTHLLRAYDTVPSAKFTNMIDHMSSKRKFATMDVFDFMLQAESKYHELVALGTWNKQDKMIMALQAELATLRQQSKDTLERLRGRIMGW